MWPNQEVTVGETHKKFNKINKRGIDSKNWNKSKVFTYTKLFFTKLKDDVDEDLPCTAIM